MKNINYFIGVLISLSIFFSSCPDGVEEVPIWITNNADHNLLAYVGLGNGGTLYPDTALPPENYTFPVDHGRMNSNVFRFSPEGKDTVCVFLLHEDTVKKYPWNIIRDEYKILKRYDIAITDLKKMNWTITYP